jgi:hypothetical protein
MPVYDADADSVDKPVLTPSRPILLWDDEVPLSSPAINPSRQFSMHRDQNLGHTVAVEIRFDGDPGNFAIDLETADTDDDDYYVTKASVTQANMNAAYVCRIEAVNIVAKFGRLNMESCDNNVAVTATVS